MSGSSVVHRLVERLLEPPGPTAEPAGPPPPWFVAAFNFVHGIRTWWWRMQQEVADSDSGHHGKAPPRVAKRPDAARRAIDAKALLRTIERAWDPIWVQPKGGHRRRRGPRQANRMGQTMNAIARGWGLSSRGSAEAGVEALEDLIAAGAIIRDPAGPFRVLPPGPADSRIESHFG